MGIGGLYLLSVPVVVPGGSLRTIDPSHPTMNAGTEHAGFSTTRQGGRGGGGRGRGDCFLRFDGFKYWHRHQN